MQWDIEAVRTRVDASYDQHLRRLGEGLESSLESLESFQSWFARSMQEIGMDVERFRVHPDDLAYQPSCLKSLREDPEALQTGSNVVGRMKGASSDQAKILLFGHADKKPETFDYGKSHPNLIEKDGRLYGPGIADDVSGLSVMVSALQVMNEMQIPPAGDVMFASILGKQMGVYGTYGLMTRFGPMDEAIYVHPAESGSGLREIKMSSNGLLELQLDVDGQAPTSGDNQTVFSATGVNAVGKAIQVCQQLSDWADEASTRYKDDHLETAAGRSVCAMISRLAGGESGELWDMPLHAQAVLMISFPPTARLEEIRNEVTATVEKAVSSDQWLRQGHLRFEWGDRIAESVTADGNSPFLRKAAQIISAVTGEEPSYYYGHGGSDIRYPMLHWDAQAFGFGPKAGNLGEEDEWVDKDEYVKTIVALVGLLAQGSRE